jgi:hypothetical protein
MTAVVACGDVVGAPGVEQKIQVNFSLRNKKLRPLAELSG